MDWCISNSFVHIGIMQSIVDACQYSWTSQANTNVENGQVVNGISNVQQCHAACINNAPCTGVDWNPTAPFNQQCWMSGPWSGQRNTGTTPGFTHYNLTRQCKITLFVFALRLWLHVGNPHTAKFPLLESFLGRRTNTLNWILSSDYLPSAKL